jgi:hypothetical protein
MAALSPPALDPQGMDLRQQMPALANKTYFNKTALPNDILQINCLPTGLSKSQGKL